MEVGQGFLVGGIDVNEDDGFGVVAGDDGAGEELPELSLIEAAEQIAERRIEREGGAVGFAGGPLKCEDGREGLHLDEARGETAAVFADEAEVGGEEMRMGVLVGGAPGLGNGGEGAGEIGGIVDELEGEVDADAGHLVEHGGGEETGSLGDREGDMRARDRVERMQHGAKGLGAEAGVEVAAEGGNHENRVQGTGGRGTGGRGSCQWSVISDQKSLGRSRANGGGATGRFAAWVGKARKIAGQRAHRPVDNS